jgi:nitrate reductase gamma subunit
MILVRYRFFGTRDSTGEPSKACDQEAQSMTTTKTMWLVSLVTAINVLVAAGFSIAGLISPHAVLPPGDAPTEASSLFALYAAARAVPLALITLAAIYRRATSALLILGTLAGVIQLLDAAIGLLQHDAGKFAGPLLIAVVQFWVLLLLHSRTRGRAATETSSPGRTRCVRP